MTAHAMRSGHRRLRRDSGRIGRLGASIITYTVGFPAVAVRMVLLALRAAARGFLGALIVFFVAGTVGMVVAWVGSLIGGLAGAIIDLPLPSQWELGDAWVALGMAVMISYVLGALSYDLIRRRRSGIELGVARRLRSGWAVIRLAAAQISIDSSAAAAINEALLSVRERDLIRVEGRRPTSSWSLPLASGVVRPAYAWPAAVLLGSTPRNRRRLEEPELTITPFVGWRRWSVVPGSVIKLEGTDPILSGVVVPAVWQQSDMEATCSPYQRWPNWGPLPTPHPAPHLDCRCGIYAMKDPEGTAWTDVGVWAEGPVRLWGRVLEGTKGYRAERARIIGPLLVRLGCRWPCTPETWLAHACSEPTALVVIDSDEYVPLCRQHAEVIPASKVPADDFMELVTTGLHARYGVEILDRRQSWT